MKLSACFTTALGLFLTSGTLASQAANWPAWRGEGGSGVSTEKHLPLKWSATENVRWKIPLPEPGDSTPIVWGNRIFLTQSFEREGGRTVMCYDRVNGQLLWKNGTNWQQAEKRYGKNPHCAASPVTDGERVIAFFGSAGLFCYDFSGKELWRRDLGQHEHEWSYAASPLLHGDLCLLYFGPGLNSRLIALDKRTGKTRWEYAEPSIEQRPRTDGFKGQEAKGVVGTFATPILVQANGRDELIQTFPQQTRAFDPRTGKLLWSCEGLNELVYSSPIYGNGVCVAMGGFFGDTLAIKPGGSGDVTATHRLWRQERTKNRLGSGVISGEHIYIYNTEGIVECMELKTGKSLWTERAGKVGPKGDSWSSMVLAGDRIYILNQSGDTLVLRASPHYEALAINSIGNELTNASTAISDGDIFIRTHKHLWCIGETKLQRSAAR